MKLFIGFTLLLIVGLAALTYWRSERNTKQALYDYPPEGRFIKLGEQTVHYVQIGEGPDIVLIHGASGNTRDFTFSLSEKLASRYRVTVFDRPGLGYSDPLPGKGASLADQAALLADAAGAIGVKEPIVLGQSYGGAVALAWALYRPNEISALVSVSGVSHTWYEPLSAFYQRLSHPVIGPLFARFLSAWASPKFVSQTLESIFEPQMAPDGYSAYIGIPLILRPEQLKENAYQRAELREEINAMVPKYPSLDLPIELVHGVSDTIVGYERHAQALAADVSSANLVGLEGVGHMPHHSHAADIIAAIDRAADRTGLNSR